MQLIASSIIILAGAVCFGLACNAEKAAAMSDGQTLATILVLVGGAVFIVEYRRSWRRDKES